MNQLLCKGTPIVVGLLFIYSGLYKLVFPGEATLALLALDAPDRVSDLMIIGITTAELYLGILLLMRIEMERTLLMASTLLFIFALFLAYLSTLAHPPSCGCMGLTAVFHSNRHNALLGLLRNCVMIWLLHGTRCQYCAMRTVSKPA